MTTISLVLATQLRGFSPALRRERYRLSRLLTPTSLMFRPAMTMAPANIADGQRLIGKVVQAVVNGPKWNKTLLVITSDEHGGFFDHVPPPPAIAVSGIDPLWCARSGLRYLPVGWPRRS